ncbi:hypothetical protein QUF72_19810 [Desulfobacterales bacterium HSG2]|nr:hypothetical protein [Desulfobacterales bacterium HSG2]
MLLRKEDAEKALNKLFFRHMIADINMLCQTLGTQSRMSVFRRLGEIGYLSSHTHAGRYYTLKNIPQFDDHGLWFHRGIGFSEFVTLRNTVTEAVRSSADGMTRHELHGLLRVNVRDTLLSLVRAELIDREKIRGLYIYVDTDHDRADRQLSQRKARIRKIEPLPAATIIEVLAEAIHAGGAPASPSVLAERPDSRGVAVNVCQIRKVFATYGMDMEKKTEKSASGTVGTEGSDNIRQQKMRPADT